jgi:hypothetical protein
MIVTMSASVLDKEKEAILTGENSPYRCKLIHSLYDIKQVLLEYKIAHSLQNKAKCNLLKLVYSPFEDVIYCYVDSEPLAEFIKQRFDSNILLPKKRQTNIDRVDRLGKCYCIELYLMSDEKIETNLAHNINYIAI